jgi:hypothetical protein
MKTVTWLPVERYCKDWFLEINFLCNYSRQTSCV